MKPWIFILLYIVFAKCALAQNSLVIYNTTDTPRGEHNSVSLTGHVPKFYISQSNFSVRNRIYYDSPISIKNAQIDTFFCKRVYFKNFSLQKCAIKTEAIFDSVPAGILSIDSNTFLSNLKINGTFDIYKIEQLSFTNNVIHGNTEFRLGSQASPAFLLDTFLGKLYLDSCHSLDISFDKCYVRDSISFNNTNLEYGIFKRSKIGRTLNLSEKKASVLLFDSTNFCKNLILSWLNPKVQIFFKNTFLPDTLDFSHNPLLENHIDLTNVSFHNTDQKCKIILYKTDIAKINLDYKFFELVFKNENGHVVTKSEMEIVYEALLKNFKDRGQNDSYERLDIEYRDLLYGKTSVRHWWNCYGYHKEWVFYWTMIFLTVFSIVNFLCLRFLINMVYFVDFFENRKFSRTLGEKNDESLAATPSINNQLTGLGNKVWYSIVYTVVIFFLFSLKMENFNFNVRHPEAKNKAKHIAGLIYIVIIHITGIACLAYMANFVLQR